MWIVAVAVFVVLAFVGFMSAVLPTTPDVPPSHGNPQPDYDEHNGFFPPYGGAA